MSLTMLDFKTREDMQAFSLKTHLSRVSTSGSLKAAHISIKIDPETQILFESSFCEKSTSLSALYHNLAEYNHGIS